MPHFCLLNYCMVLVIIVTDSIENTGSDAFDCQCLLHSYYSVPSIATTTVAGMKGYTGVESVSTGKRRGSCHVQLSCYRICGRRGLYSF